MGSSIIRHEDVVFSYPDLSVILLDVSGTSFPDRLRVATNSVGIEILCSNVDNVMYIDYDDGTGEHQYIPNSSGFIFFSEQIMHYFQDVPLNLINTIDTNYAVRRKIKIRFKHPDKVIQIRFNHIGLHGDMPKALGTYNLTSGLLVYNLTEKKWSAFPDELRGLRVSSLIFDTAFAQQLTELPDWLLNSGISTLNLVNTFNASGTAAQTKMDKIDRIKTLSTINFVSVQMGNNGLADNLKDLPLLRNIYLQYNRFTEVPIALYNATQLEYFTIGNSMLVSWGAVGFKVNNNLNRLSYTGSNATTFPTSLPTNVINCEKLKTVEFINTYRTSARLDQQIQAWYNFVIANASTAAGNSKFRNMSFNCGYSSLGTYFIRPSGNYQYSESPSTALEMIYRLVTMYGHTWTVVNTAGTGSQIFTP